MATRIDIGIDTPWLIGSSRRFTLPVTDASGAIKVLTGASVVNWIVTDIAPSEGSPTPVITKSLGSGTIVSNGPGGEIEIEVDEADTAGLTPGDYYHEVEVTDADGDTERGVAYGYVRLTGSAFVI